MEIVAEATCEEMVTEPADSSYLLIDAIE